jgi:hypothetical protein
MYLAYHLMALAADMAMTMSECRPPEESGQYRVGIAPLTRRPQFLSTIT